MGRGGFSQPTLSNLGLVALCFSYFHCSPSRRHPFLFPILARGVATIGQCAACMPKGFGAITLLGRSPLMSAEGKAAPSEQHREAQNCSPLNPEPHLPLNRSLFISPGQEEGAGRRSGEGEGWVTGSCRLPLHSVMAHASGDFPPC